MDILSLRLFVERLLVVNCLPVPQANITPGSKEGEHENAGKENEESGTRGKKHKMESHENHEAVYDRKKGCENNLKRRYRSDGGRSLSAGIAGFLLQKRPGKIGGDEDKQKYCQAQRRETERPFTESGYQGQG